MMLRRRKQEEGAVMLVVMIVLLTTTALAVFAVHSTTTEIRAAGYHRLATQAQQTGDVGMNAALTFANRVGMRQIRSAIARTEANGFTFPQPYEPPMPMNPVTGARQESYRIYPRRLEGPGMRQGAGDIYQPHVEVDLYDIAELQRVVPGMPAGSAPVKFYEFTYTARGRVRVPGDVRQTGDLRGAQEGAADLRARVMIRE